MYDTTIDAGAQTRIAMGKTASCEQALNEGIEMSLKPSQIEARISALKAQLKRARVAEREAVRADALALIAKSGLLDLSLPELEAMLATLGRHKTLHLKHATREESQQ